MGDCAASKQNACSVAEREMEFHAIYIVSQRIHIQFLSLFYTRIEINELRSFCSTASVRPLGLVAHAHYGGAAEELPSPVWKRNRLGPATAFPTRRTREENVEFSLDNSLGSVIRGPRKCTV